MTENGSKLPDSRSTVGVDSSMVVVPRDLLAHLFEVYDYYWNTYATLEPPRDLLEKGYSGLVEFDDDHAMEQRCLKVEPFEKKIRSMLEGN